MVRTPLLCFMWILENHSNLPPPWHCLWCHHWGRRDYVSPSPATDSGKALQTLHSRITGPSDPIPICSTDKHWIPVLTFTDSFSQTSNFWFYFGIRAYTSLKKTGFFWANLSAHKLTSLIFLLQKMKKKRVSQQYFYPKSLRKGSTINN